MEIIGTVLGVLGAYKLGDSRPSVIKTNSFFAISNLFLISYFIYNLDWWMVFLQLVYLVCAVRAIVNSVKRKRANKVMLKNKQIESRQIEHCINC